MLDTTKRIAWIFVLGLVTGGYGVHRLEAAPILQMAVDGWCAKQAFRTVLLFGVGFYNCQDTIIANEIQISDAQAGGRDAIADIIRATESVAKPAKAKRK